MPKNAVNTGFLRGFKSIDIRATLMAVFDVIKDNKKMPLEDLIATATKLICGGLGEYVTEFRMKQSPIPYYKGSYSKNIKAKRPAIRLV